MTDNNKEFLVAVYGTLRQGQPNAWLMSDAKFIGFDHLPAISLYDLSVFPAAIESGEDDLTVEIYQINESLLRRLDQLEGFKPTKQKDSYFVRKLMPTAYGKAWLYLFNRSIKLKPKIASGDWVFDQLSKKTNHAA